MRSYNKTADEGVPVFGTRALLADLRPQEELFLRRKQHFFQGTSKSGLSSNCVQSGGEYDCLPSVDRNGQFRNKNQSVSSPRPAVSSGAPRSQS